METRQVAPVFAESGADLISGHHAHLIQPVERYRRQRNPDRVVPILHGLGDLSPICWIPHTVLSLVANAQISTGLVEGVKQTLLGGVDLAPLVPMELHRARRYCMQPEVLGDLVGARVDAENRPYLGKIAGYADLVLGTGCRNE